MSDVYEQAYTLLKKIEETKDSFEKDAKSILKALLDKESSVDGWRRYRDVQQLVSTSRKLINQAHSEILIAVKKPTISKLSNIQKNVSAFEEAWQTAQGYGMIGLLH
jgi:hypothetical protein